jgi:uncharacterized protein
VIPARVFLDANVLFSAAWRDGSGLLRLWELGSVVLLTSGYALEEARRNLESEAQRARLDRLLRRVQVVRTPLPAAAGMTEVALPEKDRPILAAAVQAAAAVLLTGDRTHFGAFYGTRLAGVLVLPPAEYLRQCEISPDSGGR